MSNQYVVIRDMSAGNDSVGEMWKETKIFSEDATLLEVMQWAEGRHGRHGDNSSKNIVLTRAHEEDSGEVI